MKRKVKLTGSQRVQIAKDVFKEIKEQSTDKGARWLYNLGLVNTAVDNLGNADLKDIEIEEDI